MGLCSPGDGRVLASRELIPCFALLVCTALLFPIKLPLFQPRGFPGFTLVSFFAGPQDGTVTSHKLLLGSRGCFPTATARISPKVRLFPHCNSNFLWISRLFRIRWNSTDPPMPVHVFAQKDRLSFSGHFAGINISDLPPEKRVHWKLHTNPPEKLPGFAAEKWYSVNPEIN